VSRAAWRPERCIIETTRGGYVVTDGYIAAKVADISDHLPAEPGAWRRQKGEWEAAPRSRRSLITSLERGLRDRDHLDAWPVFSERGDPERPLYINPGNRQPKLWAWTNGDDLLWFNASYLDHLCRLLGDGVYDWTCNGPSSPLIAWDARGVWRGLAMPVWEALPINGVKDWQP
jgi:hypothetical protein